MTAITQFSGLSDKMQALMMFGALILPQIGIWFSLGAPMDHETLALLGSGILGAAVAGIKEVLGDSPGVVPVAPAPAAPAPGVTQAPGSAPVRS
jgi:hypothetical protein